MTEQRTLMVDGKIVYCYSSGEVEFTCNKGKGKHISKTLGYITGEGYRCIKMNGKCYMVHRLIAQAFHSKPFGKDFIDHINRNRQDNRPSNLRWVTPSENETNKLCVENSLEKYGIRWKDDSIKYRHERQKHCLTYMRPNGKQSQTGYLSDEEYNNLKRFSQKERYYKYITLKGRSSNE